MSMQSTDGGELVARIDDIHVLVLVQGTLRDGSAHYAYASIPPARYGAFKEAEAKGHYDLAAFGEILAHGEGREPPAEVQRRMAEEYGASHRFEQDLEEWIEDLKRMDSAAT